MRRRHDGERAREERDVVLGRALDELDSPEYPPDFLASVWSRVDAGDTGEPAATGGDAAADGERFEAGGIRLRPRRRPMFWARRPALVAAALAAAAAVTAVVLVGLPGLSRVTGPEPVSAAEVIQKALQALSSGSTIEADVTEKYATSMLADGPKYTIIGARVVMRSDGGYRITRTRAREVSWETPGAAPYAPGPLLLDPDGLDIAYDATTGVVRAYYRSSESPRYRCDVRTNVPLGTPDRFIDFQAGLRDLTLALQADRSATVATTTFEGEPVWVLSGTGSIPMRSENETYSVTIDQRTCLPVRVKIVQDGVVQLEYTWTNVRVDEPVPDTTFSFAAPKGVKVFHIDDGFRRLTPEQAAAAASYDLALPAWLPDGYGQTWCAFADRAVFWTDVVGRDVAQFQYTRGFDSLIVTTRAVTDEREAMAFDPFEPEPYWSEAIGRDVQLGRGAFNGAPARLVVAQRVTVPHLYAVKDGVMLTVAGRATAKELVAIAESLQPYRLASASPSASRVLGTPGDEARARGTIPGRRS
jgi:hypothetical protein